MEWRLYPQDVLFFRGSDPMNAGEHGTVVPLFPPSPEVLQGFVRTCVAEQLGATPQERKQRADALATQLQLSGPYLIVERDGGEEPERWFPAPLDLHRDGDGQWRPGALGEPVTSDLGRLRFLAEMPGAAERWIHQGGLEAYLRGQPVPAEQVAHQAAFWELEERIGVGRDRTTRATEQGMLYSPAFVRLRWRAEQRDGATHTATPAAPSRDRVGIGLRVEGLPAGCDEQALGGLTRLGGEGRTALLEVHPLPPLPAAPPGGSENVRLVLLSPARWRQADGADGWLPPGFTAVEEHGVTVWRRDAATLLGAVAGKPVRIGGWDLAQNRAKPVRACVPAGSVYFLRDPEAATLAGRINQGEDSGARSGYGWAVAGRVEHEGAAR